MKKIFATIALMGVFTLGMNQSAFAEPVDDNAQPEAAAEEQKDEPNAEASEAQQAEEPKAEEVKTETAEQADAVEPQTVEQENGEDVQETGFFAVLKRYFIEGSAGFMALPALALVLGLAFCIERIIYLSLSDISKDKLKKMKEGVEDALVNKGNLEEAKNIVKNERGPIASIYYEGLLRADDGIESVDKAVVSYGAVQATSLEKGCSWITLFIAMAPSLGFLGTVIGMVQAFDDIQKAGDISPTVVAGGMKVALLTTILGIVVALVLQLFYNYILTKIESLTAKMEDASIDLLDTTYRYNQKKA